MTARRAENRHMDQQQHHDLQRLGANARAAGLSEFDNPAYRQDQMPITTGETIEVWAAKAGAWRLGWLAEDAMRPDVVPVRRPPTAPPPSEG